MKRREFISGLALTSASLAAGQAGKSAEAPKAATPGPGPRNIIICARNGYEYIAAGYEWLERGKDTLDAAITVVSGPENDPNDDSVGLGGLPNEEGVVELDACCMHGPTRRAGAVGAVHDIKNVAALAKTVMEHTGHVMLAGEGATRFGLAMGFPKENLLTEHSRKIWQLWKESNSNQDWWGPGLADPKWTPPRPMETGSIADQPEHIQRLYAMAENIGIAPERRMDAIYKVLHPPTGTINCSALNTKGEMSSVTTTSGLSWKIPGRLGDSPIIGAGCYCDQDVGAAGATGNGEENIKVAGAHTIVENMRRGMSPEDAGMDALRRIARNYNNDMAKVKFVSMVYYILRRDGAYASVTLWSGPEGHPMSFAVCDEKGRRLENSKPLFQGVAVSWPPTPTLPK
ncbi:MAG: N(4)-(beta-N-acetylglucosaminyl)-L-asparaginase [Acidobacteriia bacterium]|nr:N(4)-(beta-N-acetylglucosaminyl)-L-asparaginase [Terriglobia bacterium]